jgi:hypothetical protein
LDQPVATFENEPNLEIMQRLSKRCVQPGLGKQKMHDGGKRALEWITAKHGGECVLTGGAHGTSKAAAVVGSKITNMAVKLIGSHEHMNRPSACYGIHGVDDQLRCKRHPEA